MTSFQQALERIQQLEINHPSRVHTLEQARALTQEHLRRIVLWRKALGERVQSLRWPGPTLADRFQPDLELPVEARHVTANRKVFERVFTQIALDQYLLWALVSSTPEVTAHDLPDPYEPLIQLFEGGYTLDKDQGCLLLLYQGVDQGVVSTVLEHYDGVEPFDSC